MKFEHTEVWGFKHALRGMRNPKESWDKSDSGEVCVNQGDVELGYQPIMEFHIGPNDMALAQRLIRAGSEHRKFMRQIIVSVDITAPQFWWSEFDTYKVGTVANSTSKMHKLASKPITQDCFEDGDYEPRLVVDDDCGAGHEVGLWTEGFMHFLEYLRKGFLKTDDKKYWKELVRWLPESWLQTRTVTMTYENLLAICSKGQRRFHKLTEWSQAFIDWARTLPYAQELIFIDEIPPNSKALRVISISGKAGAGKDTVGQVLKKKLEDQGYTVLIAHYADLLKYICKTFFDWNGEKDEAGRSLLQYVGTDVVRKCHPNFWVDFLIQMFDLFGDSWDYVIIPDCRFPNELHKIREAGYHATHIRVTRDIESGLNEGQQQHISEMAMDHETPDYIVPNNGTIEDLYDAIQVIVEP